MNDMKDTKQLQESIKSIDMNNTRATKVSNNSYFDQCPNTAFLLGNYYKRK
jgi:hypothetical protein